MQTTHYPRMCLAGLLVGSLSIGAGLGINCEDGTPLFEPAASAIPLFDAGFARLPPPGIQAKTVLPPSLGPDGSLFGLLLEDDTHAFVLGTVNQNSGEVNITGVVLLKDNGDLILQQDIRPDGSKLTFPTGDAIDIDVSGPNTRVVMTLNATSPPSVIVLDVDENGDVTLDENATQLEDELNPEFNNGSLRVRVADSPFRLRHSKSQTRAATSCADVGNALVRVVGVACQLRTAILGGLPDQARNLACILALNSVTLARDQTTPGSTAFRAFSGLRLGVSVACEGLKRVIEVTTNVSDPFGPACLFLRLLSDGVSTFNGQPLGTTICNFFTGDQELGGLLVDVSSIDLLLVDTGVDDGDEISITRNGLEVFNGIVTTGGDTISVALERGLNHFEFIALNEGRLPPNTAQVTVLGQGVDNLGDSVFSLSTGEVATLDIVRR